ncbi:MAG TPA: lipoate--protein ligase family protein [Nitrospirota bacterium]|nr:lipoate--protein ligase family protein [Nitrospirota bacterium]
MATNWKYLDSGANIAACNMASDEDLLARAQAGDVIPVLRFYTWDPPAVSLGRFQNIESAVDPAACKRHGFGIVRRPTGGRAVLHKAELTYSVIARTDNPLFPPDVLGTYKVIAEGLVAGLANLGIAAEIVSKTSRLGHLVDRNSKNPSCFSSPSWYEIVVNGKKIVGSAQRRLSHAFLQHGSILIDYDPALEAEVICGGGSAERVTSIRRELRRDVADDEVKRAMLAGFSHALGISLARPSIASK